ncbi:MAG: hypothetical protein ACUZ9M_10205 [Candidatus Scalindua sp.]
MDQTRKIPYFHQIVLGSIKKLDGCVEKYNKGEMWAFVCSV